MSNTAMRLKYFWILSFAFLAACVNQRIASPTHTPVPTVPPPTPTPSTAEPTSTFPQSTPIPTLTPAGPVYPVITPDVIQIERWNEYEEALARAFFQSYFQPEEVVCEWEILGQAEQEVYVWGLCSGIYSAGASAGSIPAVIHLGTDGSVQSAEIPGSGTAYGEDIRRIFPPGLHQRIFDHLISLESMNDRMRLRRGHPDEPPLVVLNALSIQPTPMVIAWIMPDPIQAERWWEYQKALAEPLSYLPPEKMLCEWEVLGRSGNEVYVWAICGEVTGGNVGLEGLLRIDVRNDGSVENVIPSGIGGQGSPSEIRNMFPPEVQERYFRGQIHFQELVDHLRSRQMPGHQAEPPLIILKATSAP